MKQRSVLGELPKQRRTVERKRVGLDSSRIGTHVGQKSRGPEHHMAVVVDDDDDVTYCPWDNLFHRDNYDVKKMMKMVVVDEEEEETVTTETKSKARMEVSKCYIHGAMNCPFPHYRIYDCDGEVHPHCIDDDGDHLSCMSDPISKVKAHGKSHH